MDLDSLDIGCVELMAYEERPICYFSPPKRQPLWVYVPQRLQEGAISWMVGQKGVCWEDRRERRRPRIQGGSKSLGREEQRIWLGLFSREWSSLHPQPLCTCSGFSHRGSARLAEPAGMELASEGGRQKCLPATNRTHLPRDPKEYGCCEETV